jgi:hypothetical protein
MTTDFFWLENWDCKCEHLIAMRFMLSDSLGCDDALTDEKNIEEIVAYQELEGQGRFMQVSQRQKDLVRP